MNHRVPRWNAAVLTALSLMTPRHLARTLLSSLLLASAGLVTAQVYVSSEKDNQILVLQPDGTPIKTIPVCKRPRHMAWTGGGKQILVACGDSNQLGVVDVDAGKLVDSIPTAESPEMFSLSPDGKTAYVSIEEDSELAAYDLTSKKPVFAIKTAGLDANGIPMFWRDGKKISLQEFVGFRVEASDPWGLGIPEYFE